MRRTAGVVCAIITIVIYGIAIISGIIYSDGYMKSHFNMESDFYYTWLGLIAVAAVISAIHHALWSIIDNQDEIYDKMAHLEMRLDDLSNDIKGLNTPQKAESTNAQNHTGASVIQKEIRETPAAEGGKECPFCGAWMMGSRCSNCGKVSN